MCIRDRIQSTLTVTNTDLTIGYDLATDMQVSEDGLTWTVTIRNDVKFTDGEPLTASDVAFTYNTVKEASSVNDFTMLDYAEATDDTTVVFHMVTPFSIWPYTMAIVGIVPEHAYDPATYGSNPIGSGRYILKPVSYTHLLAGPHQGQHHAGEEQPAAHAAQQPEGGRADGHVAHGKQLVAGVQCHAGHKSENGNQRGFPRCV